MGRPLLSTDGLLQTPWGQNACPLICGSNLGWAEMFYITFDLKTVENEGLDIKKSTLRKQSQTITGWSSWWIRAQH